MIFVEAGNCAGPLKSNEGERVERGSKINQETAQMYSKQWDAVVWPVLLSPLPQGTLNIQSKFLPAGLVTPYLVVSASQLPPTYPTPCPLSVLTCLHAQAYWLVGKQPLLCGRIGSATLCSAPSSCLIASTHYPNSLASGKFIPCHGEAI